MQALLLKDTYIMWRQLKFFLLILLVFTLLPGGLPMLALMYGALFPTSILSIDENAKWPSLAAMLPYKTRDLVLSKYLMGYLTCIVGAVWVVLVRLVYGFFTSDPDLTLSLPFCCEILLSLHLAALFIAINLPLQFKLGAERGRIAYLICLMVLISCITSLITIKSGDLTGPLSSVQSMRTVLYGLLLALPVTAVISWLSMQISVRVYGKRL